VRVCVCVSVPDIVPGYKKHLHLKRSIYQ
jgi:hypothetical protein